MKRIFTFEKYQVTEDLIDTKMMDFLFDYLLGEDPNYSQDFGKGNYPTFRDNFKVTIIIDKIKGKKMFFKNKNIKRI